MRRRYHVLDVFTDTRFAGNPLAVVLDCGGLDDPTMQAIAREFNLSETVFVAAPRDPANTAALRIFTPARELPFAGHPTIGSAVLLAELRAAELLSREDVGLVLEEGVGPVSCSVRHRRGEAPHARFEVPRLPEVCDPPPAVADIAAALGLSPEDIGGAGHAPSRFSAGVPFVFVPLASLAALGRAREQGPPRTEPTAWYLYAPVSEGSARTFRTRMLAAALGVPEDPATGSAAAAFAGVLATQDGLVDGEHDCFLLQGVEMGRPSRIGLAFTIAAGRITEAAIGGSAVMVAEGTLTA